MPPNGRLMHAQYNGIKFPAFLAFYVADNCARYHIVTLRRYNEWRKNEMKLSRRSTVYSVPNQWKWANIMFSENRKEFMNKKLPEIWEIDLFHDVRWFTEKYNQAFLS